MENTLLEMETILFIHVLEIKVQCGGQEPLSVYEQTTNHVTVLARTALTSVLAILSPFC